MWKYLVRRFFGTLFTIVGITIVIFILVRLVPGNVIDSILGTGATRTPEMLAQMRAFFGLDQPYIVQYFRWLGNVLRGDFGLSWRAGKPVAEMIAEALPITLELTLLAALITVVIGVPLGILSAIKKDSMVDNLCRIFSFVALGLPNFWQAAMMILFFSVVLHWFPPLNYVSFFEDPKTNLELFILPAIALGTVNVANVLRLTRSSMLEELPKDYVRTARSKGIREKYVIIRHALRNSLISIITVVGLMIGYLLGEAVAVEAVFSISGLGRLILWSIYQRDYPVTQAVLLLTCSLFVFLNFAVDVLYVVINPKVRYD